LGWVDIIANPFFRWNLLSPAYKDGFQFRRNTVVRQTALAIELGHEITHAVAGHRRERTSQQMLAQGIQVAGNVALGSNPKTVSIFNQVYGPTAQIGVLLPYSRKQESEADHYGLIFASMATYNPQEAIPSGTVWQH
jgi:predicted Zn-dependent protease